MISFSLIWVVIGLLPVLDIVPINNKFAFRYLYLPSVGFCVFLSMILYRLSARKISFARTKLKELTVYISISIIVIYSVFTIVQNMQWRNGVILWSFVRDKYPFTSAPRTNLANALYRSGHIKEAIKELKIALLFQSNRLKLAKYHRTLGIYYATLAQYDTALEEFNKAVELFPGYLDTFIILGEIYRLTGRYDESIEALNKAIELDSSLAVIYFDLGVTYYKTKDYDKALENFRTALALDPLFEKAELGIEEINKMLEKKGKKGRR